jgi:hypothetical protein
MIIQGENQVHLASLIDLNGISHDLLYDNEKVFFTLKIAKFRPKVAILNIKEGFSPNIGFSC